MHNVKNVCLGVSYVPDVALDRRVGHGSGPSADRVGSSCQWVGSGPNFRQVWRVGSGPIIPSALNVQ